MEENSSTPADEPGPVKGAFNPEEARPSQTVARRRMWLAGVAGAVVLLLAGLVPMWLKANRHANERDVARRDLQLSRLELLAAEAAIDARRGEYESARQATSQFFTALRGELDSGKRSSLRPAQRDAIKPLLEQRDSLITLLARSDPASAERLAELYLACRQALRGG